MKTKYTKEVLQTAVNNSISMAGVLRALGIRISGGMHALVSRNIKEFGLNTSHFLGKGANRGPNHKGGTKIDSLVLRMENQPRTKGQVLRRALLREGTEDVCAKCGQGPMWNGKVLTLSPDHLNGKFWDNRKENLELLCPNCHSQTETFCGRNIKNNKKG